MLGAIDQILNTKGGNKDSVVQKTQNIRVFYRETDYQLKQYIHLEL